MQLTADDLLLVTGATGLVGSHIAERARSLQIPTRALVRPATDPGPLTQWGVEVVPGDMTDPHSLAKAVDKVTVVVHCAAKVGDWGPVEGYRETNVHGLRALLDALQSSTTLKRMIHISSLGVYEARDHFGTDETEPPNAQGIDGYTLTKVESERLVLDRIEQDNLPAVVIRPGFIYGPRDRTVMPRLLDRLQSNGFKFLGSGEQLMNNTFVGNLTDAVFAAIEVDESVGEIYNVTDGKLVSKREFITTIAQLAGHPIPTKSVPLPLARFLARVMESTWRLLGKRQAPLLSAARIKFLGLNLDFCIDKAKHQLGYEPRVPFQEGMHRTIEWCRENSRN